MPVKRCLENFPVWFGVADTAGDKDIGEPSAGAEAIENGHEAGIEIGNDRESNAPLLERRQRIDRFRIESPSRWLGEISEQFIKVSVEVVESPPGLEDISD